MRPTNWYLDRICVPENQGNWEEVRRDPFFVKFLDGLDSTVAEPLLSAAFEFARRQGPYPAWARLAERGLWTATGAERESIQWKLANLAYFAGDEEQVAALTEVLLLSENERMVALAAGLSAELLTRQGKIGEALLVRMQKELPAWSRLGEHRSWAVSVGKVAEILGSRGQLEKARELFAAQRSVYEELGDGLGKARTLLGLANLSLLSGDLKEAQRQLEEEVIPGFIWVGADREVAVAQGTLAEVWEARGDRSAAMRLREEQLVVFERLGDQRERAVTLGKMAGMLQEDGKLGEALDLRQQELRVYERGGEVRARAICMGAIADILFAQGEIVEVLRIRQEEELPVYTQIGDLRSQAVCWGQVAEVLARQKKWAEALQIREEQEFPVYQKLGAMRDVVVGQTNIALLLMALGRPEEARKKLEEAQGWALEAGFGEATKIAEILGRISV